MPESYASEAFEREKFMLESQLEQIPEEAFKRWLPVLFSVATLLVAVATLLQNVASNQAAVRARESRQAAIYATGEETRGQERIVYDNYGVAGLYEELYGQAVRNGLRKGDALGLAYLNAGKDLRSLSPLLSDAYSHYDSMGFRETIELGRYESVTYVITATEYAEQRQAFAEAASAWNAKADNYVAVISILAVALFLFGLAASLHRVMRGLFLLVGVGISGYAVIWMTLTALQAVHELPSEALKQFAQGAGYDKQVSHYSYKDQADYTLNVNTNGEKAIEAYTSAIKLDEHYANAYKARGRAYLDLRPARTKEAVIDLERAIKEGNQEYDTFWSYGWALYLNGDFDKVAEPSRRALGLNKEICGPQLNIALALLAQGKLADAKSEYDLAIKRCDDIAQKAGGKPPVSLWDDMQGGVDDLDNLLCALTKNHCYGFRDLPKVDASKNASDMAQTAETLRRHLKEATTALEFQGTTVVKPTGAHMEPITFAYTPNYSENITNYAEQGVFPYTTSEGDIVALSRLSGMSNDMQVVWKVFLDGVEKTDLRDKQLWKGGTGGPLTQRVSSWYVMHPGQYEVEAYVNGELVESGEFQVAEQGTRLTNPLPADARPGAPVQVGSLLFADDFHNNWADWDLGSPSSQQEGIIDGGYTLVTHNKQHGWQVSCEQCRPFTDFYYEADTLYRAGPADYGYGLLFRWDKNSGSFYVFGVDKDGSYYVSRFANGRYNDLVSPTASPYIDKGGSNKLGVLCRKDACDFYINGKFLTRPRGSFLNGDYIGFNLDTNDLQVTFSNVRVWQVK